MWQSSNRSRALANAKKRERDRLRRPLHLKRVNATIELVSAPQTVPATSEARVILNDMSQKGMGIFSSQPLAIGQEIVVTLDEPKRIQLRGRVLWRQDHSLNSHILSSNSFSYRCGIQFLFVSPENEKTVKDFCDELNRDVLPYRQAA